MQPTQYDIAPQVLRSWMVNYICGVLGLDAATFSTSDRFDVYGLDSVEAVIMAGVMEEEFQVLVDPNQFFEYPSVDEFVGAFASGASVS
jgi:acyl carrier protein